jgi:hypothetical protein
MKRNENLYNMIENIVFDKENLETLKIAINNASNGRLPAKELRELIIQSRLKITQKIAAFFPFYHKQLTTEDSLEKFRNSSDVNTPQLEEELNDKNKLLEEIGSRVNNIFHKLKSRLGTIT